MKVRANRTSDIPLEDFATADALQLILFAEQNVDEVLGCDGLPVKRMQPSFWQSNVKLTSPV